jgi:integrase/recombinase XerD
MDKYCPENEQKKRDYAFFLEAVLGKQSATIDAALRAIERFELSINFKWFSKFHVEQARSFRARFVDELGPNGKPLSAATVATTLKHLREFFQWLSREQGFRKAIKANDAHYFTPSEQDLRIASARREKRVATLEEIKHVLDLMPAETAIEKRNRALLALTILTGARDGELASFRLKHLNLKAQTLFQDAREVRTKGRKTFTSVFFPVGPEPLAIVEAYVDFLTKEKGFGPDNPLFPAPIMGQDADRGFVAQGLSKQCWSSAAPIRRVFKDAFAAAGLPYAKPHSFRDTLVRLGQRLCRTPEEWKAWSQNLGHESEATTFVGYGLVPTHRQTEIMRGFANSTAEGPQEEDLALIETALKRLKSRAA